MPLPMSNPPPPASARSGGPSTSPLQPPVESASEVAGVRTEPSRDGVAQARPKGSSPRITTTTTITSTARRKVRRSESNDNDSDDSESDDDMGQSSSSSSHTSSSSMSLQYATSSVAVPPTPFNTVFDEYTFAEVGGPETSYISYNDENAREFDGTHTDLDGHQIATLPHGSPTASRWDHTTTFSSETDGDIPQSTRPIPAPPLLRANVVGDNNSLTPIQSSSWESKLGSNEPSDDGHGRRKQRFANRFRRRPVTQVDRDTARLQQLGYDAVLGRDYTFWSSLGIAIMNLGFIQGTVFAVPGAYKYGGPTMMLVAWPISALLSMALVSTLSELASAYPVAGGMTSWAWKCARSGVGGERYWGWIMGAIVLGGHVGNLVLLIWQAVSIITGTMGLAFVYDAEQWHKALFFLAVLIVVGTIGNTATASSGRYWIVAMCFGLTVWASLVISLLAKGVADRDFSRSAAISTHFFNATGWSSKGYVYILGWQYCTIAVGADVCAHMSEETQNPSRVVPKAMTWSIAITYVLGYISIVVCFLAVSPNSAAFIATQEFPVGHILQKAVGNNGAIALCCIIVIIMCIQIQAQLQAASRFVFAMARDRALPFSDQIKRTNKHKQPFIATCLCVALTAPFVCLLIGQAGVIYSVVTVGAATLSMLSYLIPVFLYLLSRLDLQVEGRSAWSLRKFSRPVAVVGALFCLAVIIVQTLPGTHPVKVQNISWSSVVIAGTLLISFITWKLYGNANYSGPIRALTKWETGMEIDLDSTLHASTNRGRDSGATSLKLAVTPCYPETVPTVQVNSAQTVDSNLSMGEWASASFTTTELTGGDYTDGSRTRTDSTGSVNGSFHGSRRRGTGTTTTMGRVDEVAEDEYGVDVMDPNDLGDDDADVHDHHQVDLEKGTSSEYDHYEKYDDEKRAGGGSHTH